MQRSKILAYFAIFLTVVMWGFSFLSIKISVEVLPPMTLALVRFIIASILLIFVLRRIEPGVKLQKKDMPLMMLAGIIGVTVYFYFENNGVKLITASAASIIVSTIPIFTVVADAIVYKSKMTRKKVMGVLLSVIGVYFVVGGNTSGLKIVGSLSGYFMMFGAALSWVIYSIVTKPLFKKYSQLTITTYQSIFGTLALMPFVFFEEIEWGLMNSTVIWNVAYLGVFCSALAYYFYVYAMDHLGIGISSIFLNLVPVVAVTASYFILNEKIGVNQIFGGMLVIIAVYLASFTTAKIEKEECEWKTAS